LTNIVVRREANVGTVGTRNGANLVDAAGRTWDIDYIACYDDAATNGSAVNS
jgi:hypothetical protein